LDIRRSFENYAPDVEVINGRMYFTAVGTGMFTTSDPAQGQWTPVGSLQGGQDPALFVDSDGKVYFYYGSSATDPIMGVQLDATSFAQIGSPQSLIIGDPLKHGWELKEPNATNAEIASSVMAPITFNMPRLGPSSNGMQTEFTRPAAHLGHSFTLHIALFRSRRQASSAAPATGVLSRMLRAATGMRTPR
jgi:hypothetical protein